MSSFTSPIVLNTVYALGFSTWKQQLLEQFLANTKVIAVKSLAQLPQDAVLAVWGHRAINNAALLSERNIKVISVEDGFLRSVGLGADFQVRPLSWVIDQRGIYYDATVVSDLEYLLQTYCFSPAELQRAEQLRSSIVANGLTKYNIGSQSLITLLNRLERLKKTIILVPGQVETDASLAFGAPQIRQNLTLLQAVRAANPHAYLIYKPHPDVVAGLRAQGQHEEQVHHWCDEVITDIAMDKLLNCVSEVHLLTSLAGFEALLRGKKVVCYGQPFYAGWGLTTDKFPIARRTRRLSLTELVAGSLLLYPRYLSMSDKGLITAEQAVEELLTWKSQAAAQLSWPMQLARFIHKLIKNK